MDVFQLIEIAKMCGGNIIHLQTEMICQLVDLMDLPLNKLAKLKSGETPKGAGPQHLAQPICRKI